jgi:hypothetical protein
MAEAKGPLVVIQDRRDRNHRDFNYDLELVVWRDGDDEASTRFLLAQFNSIGDACHAKALVERTAGIILGRE